MCEFKDKQDSVACKYSLNFKINKSIKTVSS